MSQWYLYVDEEVTGPFAPSDLEGRLDEDTLVCRAGEEEWQKAETVTELNDVLTDEVPSKSEPGASSESTQPQTHMDDTDQGSAQSEDEIIEPTLENFLEICEKASDQNLMNEYDNNLDEYDSQERQILTDELQERDLLQDS